MSERESEREREIRGGGGGAPAPPERGERAFQVDGRGEGGGRRVALRAARRACSPPYALIRLGVE